MPATRNNDGAAATMNWVPLALLAAAQFVMVLDSSVMNVSISQIVKDLDTTIEGVQLAITAYTLVMAALMLAGAKLGDIYGRDRIFAIGLAIYACGSFTTAISPNLPVLLFGWSLIEGIGAALVVPAIVSLIAAIYEGKQRATAFGVVGGIAGAAIAAGPLIGGWVTTEFSWRYVFAAEVVIVAVVLTMRGQLGKAGPAASPPTLDVLGVVLSTVGLGGVVLGILTGYWVLILVGAAVLAGFARWEASRERAGRDTLLDRKLLRIVQLRGGLGTLLMQQLILLGVFFVLPVYLQVVLGLNAFETGKRLFPMSVTMFVAAMAAPKVLGDRSPKRIAQIGLVTLGLSAALLVGTVDVELHRPELTVALALFGLGAGLLLSQLGNVIMSSVPPEKTNEAGGLQGTAQNLGASLGTALIGAILIGALGNGFSDRIAKNQDVPAEVRTQLQAKADEGLTVVPVSTAKATLLEAGLPENQAQEIADDYGAAQIDGLKVALGAVTILAFLSLGFTRGLPDRLGGAPPPEATPPETASAAT